VRSSASFYLSESQVACAYMCLYLPIHRESYSVYFVICLSI